MDGREFFAPGHSKMAAEFSFGFHLDHYENDDPGSKNPHRIKPKSTSLHDVVRYKRAKIVRAARFVEAHPVDENLDPMAAEYARKRIMRELNNPDNGHREVAEFTVTSALFGRMGAAEIAYSPAAGVISRFLDPKRLIWSPAHHSPHSKDCPWMMKWVSMTHDDIRMMKDAGWENTDKLVEEDDGELAYHSNDDVSQVNFGGMSSEVAGTTGVPRQNVLFYYERFNPATIKKMKNERRVLKEDERYLECEACGFQSGPQGALNARLPEMAPCPQCGQLAQRVDAKEPYDLIEAYRNGRRLVICGSKGDKTFYKGDWPFPSMRGFPISIYRAYSSPFDPWGISDVTLHRSMVLIEDMAFRSMYEQMKRSKGIIVAQEDGLKDAFGDPWQFSDYQDVAFTDNPNGSVQWFQPPAINGGTLQLLQAVQNMMYQNKGAGQVNMTPEQSRDIAVGTIRTMVESGDVPVDEHAQEFQGFWSRHCTRMLEALMDVEQPEDVERAMGREWSALYQQLKPQMVQGVDIILTAEPNITQEKMDLAQKIGPLLDDPSDAKVRLMGDLMGIPRSMLDKYRQDRQIEMQQMMAQQAQQAMQMAAMGGGQPPGASPNGAKPRQGNQ